MPTRTPGIRAAGDACANSTKQAASAAGEGAAAAMAFRRDVGDPAGRLRPLQLDRALSSALRKVLGHRPHHDRPYCFCMLRPVSSARPYAVRPSADILGAALEGDVVHVHSADGRAHVLDAVRWLGPARGADLDLLSRVDGPAIDVGCGPGRLVAALTAGGVPALGVDIDAVAVRMACEAGGAALRRSVFRRLPGEGRWEHALLIDGNIGIGGDPARLLRRCAELLASSGLVHVEMAAAGGVRSGALRLVHRGAPGAWFPWTMVGVDGADVVAAAAGLHVRELWSADDGGEQRWFAVLTKS